jgi:hypothetical protein
MGNVVDVLATIRSGAVSRADLAELGRLEAQVTDLVQRAQRASTNEQRRQLASRMDVPLEAAARISTRQVASAGGAVNVPLPISGGAWQYVARVTVDGSPADSVEFAVDGAQAWLPAVSRHAPIAP